MALRTWLIMPAPHRSWLELEMQVLTVLTGFDLGSG
jgi:hypothetical protein